MDQRSEKLLVGLETNTKVASTEYGKMLEKMMAGDGDLLEELSSSVEIAKNVVGDTETAERFIIGRVLRTVRDDQQAEGTHDDESIEGDKHRLWCGLAVKITTGRSHPYKSKISRLKKDEATGWIQEGGKLVPLRDDLLQHGLFDPRLGLSYWYRQGRDEDGRETVACKDAGMKKADVLRTYREFLIRLWAYKLENAKSTETRQEATESLTEKPKQTSDEEPTSHQKPPSMQRKTSAQSPLATVQHSAHRDEPAEAGAADELAAPTTSGETKPSTSAANKTKAIRPRRTGFRRLLIRTGGPSTK